MGDTYSLDGIPSDTLTSDNIGTRRFKVSTTETGVQKQLIYKRLTNDSSDFDMAIDGSVTPVEFYISPPDGEVWMIAQWMLYLQDDKGFEITTLGSDGLLANGLEVRYNGIDILDGTIKSNGHIAGLAYDMALHTFGNQDDILVAKWAFTQAGQYMRLTSSDRLGVLVQDNLTGISEMYIQVQGYKE